MWLYDSIPAQKSAQGDEQWGNLCMRAQHKATENYGMNISASGLEYPKYLTSLFVSSQSKILSRTRNETNLTEVILTLLNTTQYFKTLFLGVEVQGMGWDNSKLARK